MKHNKGTRKTTFSTGTIFVSEDEMRSSIRGSFAFNTNHQIHLSKLMKLRKEMIREKDTGKLGNGIVYFTLSKEMDHAHLHFLSDDLKSAECFFELLKTLDEYMYTEKK